LLVALDAFQYHGEPVVAIQVDNEPGYGSSELADPLSWGYSIDLINLYRSWLGKTYENVEGNNRFHGTAYRDFSDVLPPEKGGSRTAVTAEGWLVLQD
jgi:hypothetical protein